MNILHIIASNKYSGAGAAALTMVRALLRRGHTLSFLCYPNCRLEAMADQIGCHVIRDFDLSANVHYGWNYLFPGKLRELCQGLGVEVIHSHRSRDHSLVARCHTRRQSRRPLIVRSWHQGSVVEIPPLKRRLFASADRLLVCNSEVAASIKEAAPNLKSRISVQHGGVDADVFTVPVEASSVRRALGVPADGVLVGMISRLKANRGHEVLIDAIGRLPDEAPIHFVLIGEGELDGPLRKMIHESGLGHRVKIHVPGAEFVRTLAALDFAVQLAPGSDGSCRAALECMTMGVPVIAPRSGTFAEIIEHGVTGFLIHPPLAGLLAAAITRLATDRHFVETLSRNARDRALERFNLDALGERLEELYQDAQKSRQNGGQ